MSSKLKSSCDRRSVGQYVIVSSSHLELMTRSFFLSDNCWFLDVGCPLWREDGSVIYCTIASGPWHSSHSRVQVPQNSRPYFTVSFETLPTWRARSTYLLVYPPGTEWPNYAVRLCITCFIHPSTSGVQSWRESSSNTTLYICVYLDLYIHQLQGYKVEENLGRIPLCISVCILIYTSINFRGTRLKRI
jgi:hypothetical protein